MPNDIATDLPLAIPSPDSEVDHLTPEAPEKGGFS